MADAENRSFVAVDVDGNERVFATEVEMLREYLQQIAQVSFIHYIGGAYDPEHMRSISNAAICALNGGKFDGDYEEEMRHRWKEYPDPYHVQELEEWSKRCKKRIKRLKSKLTTEGIKRRVLMLQKRHATFDQNRSTWMQKDCSKCSVSMIWDVGWINDLTEPDVEGVRCWSCGEINPLVRSFLKPDEFEPCTESSLIAESFEPPQSCAR